MKEILSSFSFDDQGINITKMLELGTKENDILQTKIDYS